MNFWQVAILLNIFHHEYVLAFTVNPSVISRSSALAVGATLTSDLMTPFNATHIDRSHENRFYGDSNDMWSSDDQEDDEQEDYDLSSVEFVSAQSIERPSDHEVLQSADMAYPFAGMLRNSAPYIADHSQRTAVFYIPGDFMDSPGVSSLMGDICLSWMLGLKIVLIVGCRFDNDGCSLDFNNRAECCNSMRVTDDELLRKVEEEAGFVRFEVERLLNRHLRHHGGMGSSAGEDGALNGNVVGGNFYTARPYGVIDHVDYKNTGYPTKVYTERIETSLKNDDIVVLSTIGTSRLGDVVNVNGNHLAATVAAALKARKLVYLSNSGTVLRRKGSPKTMQEIPLKFSKALLKHYGVHVNQAGFVAFKQAAEDIDPAAVELLLHLGWSTWALDQGVNRAHIVNPGDGSLLEELFSSKLGLNTCLYIEDEAEDLDV